MVVNVPANKLTEAQDYCRRLATTHYENFSVASLLIPKPLRQDFYHIYAYCRWSDDLADEQASPSIALQALRSWREQVLRSFSGEESDSLILTALVDTVKRRNLATKPFFDLLDAFERDQQQNRYENSSDLLTYCEGSANPVGRIILNLAGIATPRELELSDLICTGLQLVNFCQDMKRDSQINRIYMPSALYTRFGVTEETILAARSTPEMQAALRHWVEQSRQYLLRGWKLWENVPRWLARDIHLFAGGGLAICDAIAANQFDVWTDRPTVRKSTKLKLLIRSCLTHRLPKSKYFTNAKEDTA